MEIKAQSAARMMRVMKYAFVVSAFLFIFVAIKVPVQPGPPVNQELQMIIAFVAHEPRSGLLPAAINFPGRSKYDAEQLG